MVVDETVRTERCIVLLLDGTCPGHHAMLVGGNITVGGGKSLVFEGFYALDCSGGQRRRLLHVSAISSSPRDVLDFGEENISSSGCCILLRNR